MKKKDLRKWAWLCMILLFLSSLSIAETAEEKEPLEGKTVNINTATAEELAENVPLISLDLAIRIVEYREENGDFMVLEELLQVEGFTRTLLKRVKPFLLLEGLGGDDCTC